MKKYAFLIALSITIFSCKKSSETLIGNWQTRPGGFAGSARFGAVAFTINEKGYIGTGYNNSKVKIKSFYEYDPVNDVWTQKADFGGVGRNQAVGFSIGTKGYVGTGTDIDSDYLRDFWEYDPEADRWTRKADLGNTKKTGRRNAVGFALGDKGYVGTGYGIDPDDTNSVTYRGDMWEFDPADVSNGTDENGLPMGKWIIKADFAGSKRYGALAFVINNKAYIGTGTSNGAYPVDFYEFDPSVGTSGKWTREEDFGTASSGVSGRVSAVAFVINNKGYVVGGVASGNLADCWEFDPVGDSNGTWVQRQNFEGTARNSAVGFSIGNKGYLGTGSGPYDDFWRFDPTAAYVATTDDKW